MQSRTHEHKTIHMGKHCSDIASLSVSSTVLASDLALLFGHDQVCLDKPDKCHHPLIVATYQRMLTSWSYHCPCLHQQRPPWLKYLDSAEMRVGLPVTPMTNVNL